MGPDNKFILRMKSKKIETCETERYQFTHTDARSRTASCNIVHLFVCRARAYTHSGYVCTAHILVHPPSVLLCVYTTRTNANNNTTAQNTWTQRLNKAHQTFRRRFGLLCVGRSVCDARARKTPRHRPTVSTQLLCACLCVRVCPCA